MIGKGLILSILWLFIPSAVVLLFITLLYTGDREMLTIAATLLVMVFLLTRIALSKTQKQTLQTLCQYDDLRSLSPLIVALDWPDTPTNDIVISALTRLLPHLKASDAAFLNEMARSRLCLELNRGVVKTNPDFALAILQAFEQVGDEKAIPSVRALADGPAKTTNEERVQEAARSCLEFLTIRAQQQHAHQTLLRASKPNSVDPVELLRATGECDVDPAQMLRATAPEQQASP